MPLSRQESAELHCPACRSAFDAPLWIVVDANERPDLLAALRAGTLHQATCPHCGTSGTITAPLLYHDAPRQQLLLAVPPSVESPAAAQELAEQLVGYLHESLLASAPLPAYLTSVELVADLDGLQLLLDEAETESHELASAIEALLATTTAAEFQAQFMHHRTTLLRPETDALLAALHTEARAHADHATARRINDQRAALGRFRATLQARRAAVDEILAALDVAPTHAAILPTLRTMLHAIQPQDVYAARLQLSRAEQTLLDETLDRVIAIAETAHHDDLLQFLHAIGRLREL